MKGLLLNKLKLGDKYFDITDSRGAMPRTSFGLNETFYGGRVKQFAKTDRKGVYLCIEKNTVIDIYIPDIADLELKDIKAIATMKGIEYQKNYTKKDMLKLFGIEVSESEGQEEGEE